jgi:putative transferase (TIGR04331 family)
MAIIPIKVESESVDEFGLFPNEAGGGIVISQEEMRKLSLSYSKLYEVYIASLSTRFMENFDISRPAACTLVRHAFVPLMFCFMDRLVRINKLLSDFSGQFVLPNQHQSHTFELIEDFQESSLNSPEFNQYLIWFIGRIWNFREVKLNIKQTSYDTHQPGFKNNIFRLYRRTPLRLLRILYISILKLINKPELPALTMSNNSNAFRYYGFYAKYLNSLNFSLPDTDIKIDDNLRKKLFTDNLISTTELNEFFDSLGFGSTEKKRSVILFKEFIQLHYPTSLLEAIPQNIKPALDAINSFKSTVLVSSGSRSTSSTYIFAAAKEEGRFIVDCQHGGYYGYIDNWPLVSELEYPGIDQFVSWGWTRAPQQVIGNGFTIADLPSPWLSERKKYWKRLKLSVDKEYDFLFMSTKVKRFSVSPQGGLLARDLLQKTAKDLKGLVDKITSNQYKILHKPCDVTTVKLLSKTMDELLIIGGAKYDVITKLDKGLTYELLNKCNVVLWDQPGTGFLECLSSGIPTMLSWKRTSSSEEEWTKPIFQELEKCGIIHRDDDTLVTEMKRFKESPKLWMSTPERVELVNRFCRQFAWASMDWPKYWRKYFDDITEIRKA